MSIPMQTIPNFHIPTSMWSNYYVNKQVQYQSCSICEDERLDEIDEKMKRQKAELINLGKQYGSTKLIYIYNIKWLESSVKIISDYGEELEKPIPEEIYAFIPERIWEDESSQEFANFIYKIKSVMEEKFEASIDGDFSIDLEPQIPKHIEELFRKYKKDKSNVSSFSVEKKSFLYNRKSLFVIYTPNDEKERSPPII